MVDSALFAGRPQIPIQSVEDSLNKPLPALPQPPYFEYMFANAGIEAGKFKDSAKPSCMRRSPSVILDKSEITDFAFAQAGVNLFVEGR